MEIDFLIFLTVDRETVRYLGRTCLSYLPPKIVIRSTGRFFIWGCCTLQAHWRKTRTITRAFWSESNILFSNQLLCSTKYSVVQYCHNVFLFSPYILTSVFLFCILLFSHLSSYSFQLFSCFLYPAISSALYGYSIEV